MFGRASGKVIEPATISDRGIYFIAADGRYTLNVVYSGYKKASTEVQFDSEDMKAVQSTLKPVYIRLESE